MEHRKSTNHCVANKHLNMTKQSVTASLFVQQASFGLVSRTLTLFPFLSLPTHTNRRVRNGLPLSSAEDAAWRQWSGLPPRQETKRKNKLPKSSSSRRSVFGCRLRSTGKLQHCPRGSPSKSRHLLSLVRCLGRLGSTGNFDLLGEGFVRGFRILFMRQLEAFGGHYFLESLVPGRHLAQSELLDEHSKCCTQRFLFDSIHTHLRQFTVYGAFPSELHTFYS